MIRPPLHQPLRFVIGFCLYLGLGFSLGWYYTFTYYGAVGWPMPAPEAWGSLLLYYFSVINTHTEIQAVHWMLVFPLAGVLWAALLARVGHAQKVHGGGFAELWWMGALCALPLVLIGPVLALLAGQTDSGFEFSRMIAVALRRAHRSPGVWLSPLCLALSLAGLAAHILLYKRRTGSPWSRILKTYGIAAIAYVLTCTLLGATLSIPLRVLFE